MVDRNVDYDTQMTIWGCDVAGDLLEVSALISEKPDWIAGQQHMWDRDLSHLNRIERHIDGESHPAPWWWALPYVSQQIVELHIMTGF